CFIGSMTVSMIGIRNETPKFRMVPIGSSTKEITLDNALIADCPMTSLPSWSAACWIWLMAEPTSLLPVLLAEVGEVEEVGELELAGSLVVLEPSEPEVPSDP